ncbi:hypothetical protein C5167_042941 [Papaver somniferum]|uniref:protein disulfide-isomerase n=1 Tax=Papaver somniferum TaxID=3469 RepID=A0A4Y7L7D7_PAPSO|nr:hypothetical protein C5167_042941 [Papaver somniferum]
MSSSASWIGSILFLVYISASASALYGPSSPVLQLTPSNFKSKVLNANGIVLVEFFAPWCGHCKSLTPVWEKAASVLKGVVTIAALDVDAHQALAQEYGIKGFPTIKVFFPGKPPVDYQGARDAKAIVDFASKQVKALITDRLNGKTSSGGSSKKKEPSASVELNSKNFDDMVTKSKDLWIVEFFAPWCGHCKKLAPEWTKASINLKGKVKLGHVDCDSEKSLMSRFSVQGFPTILVFGSDKDRPVPYEGARVAAAIESFALEQLETNVSPPEVIELTGQDVLEEKCGSAAICFVSFLPDILDSKAEGRNKYLQQLLSTAEKNKRSPYRQVKLTPESYITALPTLRAFPCFHGKGTHISLGYGVVRQAFHVLVVVYLKLVYVWAAAGKQPDLEKQVGVGGYGYPAMVALNLRKKAYAPLRSAFQLDHILEFVKEAAGGGKGNLPLETTPTILKTEPWDGKDGQILEEDEFSLEELMGGDDTTDKDEL